MNKIKVVNKEDIINGNEEIFEPIKARVTEVMLGVLRGVKRNGGKASGD